VTPLEICNQALSRVGAARLTSLLDDTSAAEHCRIHLDSAIKQVLASRAWQCASDWRAVNAAALAPMNPRYTQKFPVPVDMLRVLEACTVAGETNLDWSLEGRDVLASDVPAPGVPVQGGGAGTITPLGTDTIGLVLTGAPTHSGRLEISVEENPNERLLPSAVVYPLLDLEAIGRPECTFSETGDVWVFYKKTIGGHEGIWVTVNGYAPWALGNATRLFIDNASFNAFKTVLETQGYTANWAIRCLPGFLLYNMMAAAGTVPGGDQTNQLMAQIASMKLFNMFFRLTNSVASHAENDLVQFTSNVMTDYGLRFKLLWNGEQISTIRFGGAETNIDLGDTDDRLDGLTLTIADIADYYVQGDFERYTWAGFGTWAWDCVASGALGVDEDDPTILLRGVIQPSPVVVQGYTAAREVADNGYPEPLSATIAARLAIELAIPLVESTSLKDECLKDYARLYHDAKILDGMQGRSMVQRSRIDLLAARR
jgi:hypothetical protein